ncbi:MAG: hypothetical protein ACE5IY_13810 [bacterium]
MSNKASELEVLPGSSKKMARAEASQIRCASASRQKEKKSPKKGEAIMEVLPAKHKKNFALSPQMRSLSWKCFQV